MARKSQTTLDNEVIARIRKRVSSWFDYYSINNRKYKDLMKFVYLEEGQWTDAEIAEYKQEGRPRLTFNMLPRYVTNLAAQFSENVPELEVRSEHFEDVDQKQIDIVTNLTRNISFDSRNDIVYQRAFESAVIGGFGAFRIVIERERPGTFNQTIRYKQIYDPTTCFWDPMAKHVDKQDGICCGISVQMSKSEFKSKYNGIEPPTNQLDINNDNFTWVSDDIVTVVDYWEKVPCKRKLAQLSDGSVVDADEAESTVRQKNKEISQLLQMYPASPVQKIRIEKVEAQDDYKIMFYRVTKDTILERSEWDGRHLPVIFMGGFIKWVDGRERTYGLINGMIDAQRAYNYARSEYLYRLQLSRYEKFLVTKENVAGNEEMWKNPHKARSALIYKRGINGEVPIVVGANPIGDDLQAEMSRSLQDLQLIPGRFDPNFGGQGNEYSGVAISNRMQGGNLNVKELFDNARKAIESGAIVVVDLIPKIYDAQRNITLTKKDGSQESTYINSSKDNKMPGTDIFFSVKVTVGSSFAIQQEENARKLLEFAQSNPEFAKLTSDLLIKNMNLQQGPQLVERIQRFGIPEIVAQEGSKDPIVMQNAQQKMQPSPQDQVAMEMAQIKLRQEEQKLLIDRLKASDDRIDAMATQVNSIANMMNAQTNRIESQGKNYREDQKAIAEQRKAELDTETEAIKAYAELAKSQSQNIIGSMTNLLTGDQYE